MPQTSKPSAANQIKFNRNQKAFGRKPAPAAFLLSRRPLSQQRGAPCRKPKAFQLNKVHFLRVNKHKLGGRYGCFESHLKMYKIALDKKVLCALIFEDEFYLRTKTTNKTINLALRCIKENPDFYKISLQNSGTVRANKRN